MGTSYRRPLTVVASDGSAGGPGDVDLTEGVREFWRFHKEHKESTVEAYTDRLGYLESKLGKPWPEVTPTDCYRLNKDRLRGEWEVGASTLRGWFNALKSAMFWARVEGKFEVDPLIFEIAMPKCDDDGPPPLPHSKMQALLEACERPLEFRLVYYPSYGGCRISEAAAMEGPMWQDGWLRFPGMKKRSLTEVPIHPELERVKWMLWASLPTTKDSLKVVKERLVKRVGFYFVVHQLRKTFSTTLEDNDVPWVPVIESLLGHSPTNVGHRHGYGHCPRRKKLEAMDTLDYYSAVLLERTAL